MYEVQYIIKNWKHEAKARRVIQYKYIRNENKLILYTSEPGILIGAHGRLIEKYTKLLQEVVYPNIRKVDLVEVESHWA